jgi:hypothetical protein
MSVLPKVKGSRQGDYAVSYYALGREPTPSGLHGYLVNIGTYDSQREAVKVAEDARLKLKHIGGVVCVHETGVAEAMLSDEARSSRPKEMISADVASMYSRQQKEEREKLLAQQKEIQDRQQQIELETSAYEDPASLDYYAKLHMRRRMLEETLAAQQQSLEAARRSLEELRVEVGEKEEQHPHFRDEWRDYLRAKLPKDKGEPFFLRER